MTSSAVGPTDELLADASALSTAIKSARRGLVDRALITETVALCAVAGEHLLVIGPPGTAKSEAVRRVAQQLGGRYFEYLLGRFTEPNEIFGPVDLRLLREGIVAIETTGMLPEADVAFLDEVFLGSTAILNTLLGILNERSFRRGSTATTCPLRVCVGAANSLPDDPALAAFADRFVARVFIEPVSDSRLEELLETGWAAGGPDAASTVRTPGSATSLLASVDRLALGARQCDLTLVRPTLARAVRRLRAAGVPLSDRRAIRLQRLVAAAAVIDGRMVAGDNDLWVLPLVAPTADTQVLTRETLTDMLGTSLSSTLVDSAAELSKGPAANAERLRQEGQSIIAHLDSTTPSSDDVLRIEAALREIDATVSAENVNNGLREVRARLAALLG